MVGTRRLLLFLRTLNPNTYAKLCEELTLKDSFTQFLFTFALLMLVMLLLLFPAIMVGAPRLHEAVNSFDAFDLDANVSAHAPVVLVKHPLVAVDLGENVTLKSETLLFTEKGIEWHPYYYFGHAQATWDDVRDAREYSDDTYKYLIIFLVPSLAFWLGLLLLFKDLLLVLLFGLVAFLLPRIWHFTISFTNTLKVALYSSSIMVLIEMTLFPFVRILWLPVLFYLVFLVVGVILVGDRDLDDHPVKKKPHHTKPEPWE